MGGVLLQYQRTFGEIRSQAAVDFLHSRDLVYLKFRAYRPSTLFSAANRKLAPRYFGPFRVEARIGEAAYRLKLPHGSRIHLVFHVKNP